MSMLTMLRLIQYGRQFTHEVSFVINKIMFIWTWSLSNTFRQLTVHVRINIISELSKLVKKLEKFNFKLYSSNVPVILRYYYN